jgi:hypothetical protein
MKEDIEAALARGETSDGTGRSGPAGFVIESDNVSLEVEGRCQDLRLSTIPQSIKAKHNTGEENRGQSLHMTQSIAYVNRIHTGLMG